METGIMGTLEGKFALVTGGSRGIGEAIVRRLAAEGAGVAFTYRASAELAANLVKQITADGGRSLAIKADAREAAEVSAAVAAAVAEFGALDILVNNAGDMVATPFDETPDAEVERILAINVGAVFVAAREAAKVLPDGGRIINIGSCLAERIPGPGITLYSATKAALTGLTRGLSRDLGARGITVTQVNPGPTDTEMNPADGPTADYQRGQTALGRFGTAADIAATVAYLAGPDGAYITGTAIAVDGGFAA
jgi:3-oxoacyl-[acyl-carrier protein] reductase